MERKALGKGIGALIPEKEPETERRVTTAKVSLIKANPFQPREYFDNEGMAELIQSVKEKGVIQPVIVRPRGEYFELIAGERRLRAAQSLNLDEIPVIIRDAQDQDSLELSLIENIQRQDLNPLEEARAFSYLIDKFNITQEKLSEVLGKSRASVANTLRLLNLPQEIQEEIKNGRISFGHARALLEVEDPNQQRRLVQQTISNSLSVRELENLIKRHRPKASRQKTRSADTFTGVLEEELQHILATKVRVIKRKKRGHIVIEFYSNEDLERIIKMIRGGKNS